MSDTLCTKCNKFFGNPQKLNMCSVCFKEHQKSQNIVEEISKFKMEELPELPVSKQEDHGRCFVCKKKIGLLGIRCKGCECSFCNVHRMPQDHKCEVKMYLAKTEIKKNIPNITAPKIQQI